MAIAAAAPALSERVEPRWVMATSREQPATMAGVRPWPLRTEDQAGLSHETAAFQG